MYEAHLYRRHKLGVGEWHVKVEDATIQVHFSTTLGGAIQTKSESFTEGKQGRDAHGQAVFEAQSKVRRMMDKGYVDSLDKVGNVPMNTLGLITPMLALKYCDVKDHIDWQTAVLQPKLNGFRLLVTRTEDGIIAYTRQGKRLETIPHIIGFYDKVLPPFDPDFNVTVDGELYVHGHPLQTIASWAKRTQSGTYLLKHWVYDCTVENKDQLTYMYRNHVLQEMLDGRDGPYEITPTLTDFEKHDLGVRAILREWLNQGYEGAMLRQKMLGYESGRRSSGLIKVKTQHFGDTNKEEEFKVISIRPSKDGWAILRCSKPGWKDFDVSAPGNMSQKLEVIQNPDKYIGREVTIEYGEITKEGAPFHAVATQWREEI